MYGDGGAGEMLPPGLGMAADRGLWAMRLPGNDDYYTTVPAEEVNLTMVALEDPEAAEKSGTAYVTLRTVMKKRVRPSAGAGLARGGRV